MRAFDSKRPALGWLLIVLLLPMVCQAADSKALKPVKVAGGVIFGVRGTDPARVWAVGEFNDWGGAGRGTTPTGTTAELRPDGEGLRTVTLQIAPGTYRFHYLLEGHSEPLLVGAEAMPNSPEGDNILVVGADGSVPAAGAPYIYPPRAMPRGVEFRVYAAKAGSAFLAGPFNNWANAVDDRVTDPAFQMIQLKGHEFVLSLPVPPGATDYAIVLDGEPGGWLRTSADLPAQLEPVALAPATIAAAAPPATPLPAGRIVLLPPRVVPGGVQFGVHAPGMRDVAVAGDFNGWGNAKKGVLTTPRVMMEPLEGGFFTKTVVLLDGHYAFKYWYHGTWEGIPEADLPRDVGANSTFTLKDGEIPERAGRPDPWERWQSVADQGIGPPPVRPTLLAFFLPGHELSRIMRDWMDTPEAYEATSSITLQFVDAKRGEAITREFGVARVPSAVLIGPDRKELGRVVFMGDAEVFRVELHKLLTEFQAPE